MKTINALYDNLLLLIDSVVGDDADAFELTLNGADKTNFSTKITTIIDEQNIIDATLTGGLIYPGADLLIQSLQGLSSDFPAYSMPRKAEILTYLTLYKSLVTIWTTVPTYRLRPSIFKLIPINVGALIHKNYFYHDTNELTNSVFLITLTDINVLAEHLNSGVISEVLILYLLTKLDVSVPLTNSTFILIKAQRNYNIKEILAFIKFQMIIEGKFTHQPYEVAHLPSTFNRNRIKIGNGYHQFVDTLMILSEYNYQKDLIDKYLRLYHVLENDMYRTQIVQVESSSAGLFSIRDFQRLYNNINKGEEAVLKSLFTDAFELYYTPGTRFKQFLLARLTAIRASMTDAVLDAMFTLLRINKKDVRSYVLNSINLDSIVGFYTTVVYMFRNSMVHNRETEFHLMHETLSPEIKQFIESFLIPTMEELVILLTIERNDIVWYTNSKISVYQE